MTRNGWNTTQPIRDAFKAGSAVAGLPYFNPHSVRDMLAQLGERVCRTPEEFKAWPQNLWHSGVLTTLTSYGTVPDHRQADLIHRMSSPVLDCDSLGGADFAQLLAALAKMGRFDLF